MLPSEPRRFWVSSMIVPTYSGGVMTVALTYGSSISAILSRAGSLAGLSICSTFPSVIVTRKTTEGEVAIRSRL